MFMCLIFVEMERGNILLRQSSSVDVIICCGMVIFLFPHHILVADNEISGLCGYLGPKKQRKNK